MKEKDTCPSCKEGYMLRLHHPDVKEGDYFECDFCGAVFTVRGELCSTPE